MKDWQFLPICKNAKTGMTRHAALAWNLGEKVLWIEPQYLDPWNCSHAMHIVEGEATEEGGALLVGDWEIRSAEETGEVDRGQGEWLKAINGDAEKEKAKLERETPELQDVD